MDIERIKNLVQADCERDTNIFTSLFYTKHIVPVADNALRLGRHYGADLEIIEIAAYLHDIAAIREPKRLRSHELEGSIIAEGILREEHVPEIVIERVKTCIAGHSIPCASNSDLESMCLANADVLAKLDEIGYWFYFLYGVRKVSHKLGIEWIRAQVLTKWEVLDEYSKEIGLEKLNALRILLNI